MNQGSYVVTDRCGRVSRRGPAVPRSSAPRPPASPRFLEQRITTAADLHAALRATASVKASARPSAVARASTRTPRHVATIRRSTSTGSSTACLPAPDTWSIRNESPNAGDTPCPTCAARQSDSTSSGSSAIPNVTISTCPGLSSNVDGRKGKFASRSPIRSHGAQVGCGGLPTDRANCGARRPCQPASDDGPESPCRFPRIPVPVRPRGDCGRHGCTGTAHVQSRDVFLPSTVVPVWGRGGSDRFVAHLRASLARPQSESDGRRPRRRLPTQLSALPQ